MRFLLSFLALLSIASAAPNAGDVKIEVYLDNGCSQVCWVTPTAGQGLVWNGSSVPASAGMSTACGTAVANSIAAAIAANPGPTGATGPKGDKGDTGATGAAGANATTTASATTSTAGLMPAASFAKLAGIQYAEITVTGSGRATWTYTTPYVTPPKVMCVAIQPTGATVSYNASIYGDPGTISTTFQVNTINSSVVVGVLNAVLGITTAAPNGTKLHVVAFGP